MSPPVAEKPEDPIPINPYWVGGGFLDYCVKQAWMVKRREGRATRFYCTPAGVEALKQFGIEILRPEARRPKRRRRISRP